MLTISRWFVPVVGLLICYGNLSADEVPPGQGKKDGLSLTARLEKKVYRPGEDITLSFTLKNESDKELYIGDGFLAPTYHEVGNKRHFELHLIDENKARLRFWSDIST